MERRTHILIAEPSLIIRTGIISVLKRLTVLNIDLAEIKELSSLTAQICRHQPDILIINPAHLGLQSLLQLKNSGSSKSLKILALQLTLADHQTLQEYDGSISIYDSSSCIKDKLLSLIQVKSPPQETRNLSAREKEIVTCIAKGLTTKQIAEKLCVSVHTVMTHRRNITSKLEIHSLAGLTIYAIVNKLIALTDIQYNILNK